MAFWCYILRCADGRYYTGHTDNLEQRVSQHEAGRGSDFTARRQPVMLVWAQDFPSRLEALEAERPISPWSRKKKEAMIASDWQALSYWAKAPDARPSTALGTNGEESVGTQEPFVPSEVEARASSPVP